MPKVTPEQEREDAIIHILAELASGRPISRVLREDENMPPKTTFWRWFAEDEDLRGKVTQAREHAVEAMLDEAVEIADDGSNDTYVEDDAEGNSFVKTDHDVIQRSRLRVDTRIKMAQMLKPKTYGPKLDLTSGGEKLQLRDMIDQAKKAEQERLDNGEE